MAKSKKLLHSGLVTDSDGKEQKVTSHSGLVRDSDGHVQVLTKFHIGTGPGKVGKITRIVYSNVSIFM